MMRNYLLILSLALACFANAQKPVVNSKTIIIDGEVKEVKKYTLDELGQFTQQNIPDLVLYNHDGTPKDTLREMKGVALIDLLKDVEFQYANSKELSAFVFLLTAADGYVATCSWSELYNTDTGKNFFIVTEINHQRGEEIPHHILFLSRQDIKPNRRYIRGLERIEVKNLSTKK
jgi:hypothetical protein